MQFLFERRCCLAITAAAALVVAGAGLGARDCTSTLALFSAAAEDRDDQVEGGGGGAAHWLQAIAASDA